jgi:ABC-type Mn2+/Zn2+ transport system ATPase subunit
VAQITINIPGFGEHVGDAPIVILGPNGSGKTQLAQKIAQQNQQVSAISAQRRTWVDDNLPVQEEQQLRSNIKSHQDQWRQRSWQPTEEINFVLSTLIQDHTNLLTRRNEEAIDSNKALDPVRDTKLILLQDLWNRLFPKRKLEIGGFFPKVKRLDGASGQPPYHLREMSDGERTVLYMAARVLTAEQPVILVDEPEIHMHSRLAVHFWDEAERLRPDCRFVYVTHDLNFTLSRRRATVLLARTNASAETILADELPASVAADVLGAATLPFYAKRIFLYEGESGKGFASEFFSAWFDDEETFANPSGDRNSVIAAVVGLKTVGVVAAEVIGLVDRDFYPDVVLNSVPNGVLVLPLHEIESVLCDRRVVAAVAEHLGKSPDTIWKEFHTRVRNVYTGKTRNATVARRVRSRVGDLLGGAFNGDQIDPDFTVTASNHVTTLTALDLPAKTEAMFREESEGVDAAVEGGGKDMLAILPGKHLLSLLASVLGLGNTSDLTSLVIRSLSPGQRDEGSSLCELGERVEAALLAYLPPRRASGTILTPITCDTPSC